MSDPSDPSPFPSTIVVSPDNLFAGVSVVLPNGTTTDELPLLLTDFASFDAKNRATLNKRWEKVVLDKVFTSLKLYFDLHDLDPDDSHLESLKALFITPNETSLHFDSLSLLYINPDSNKMPCYSSAFATFLSMHMNSLKYEATAESFHIQLKFVGRAQRLLVEACTPANQISISSPDNSPQLMHKIDELIQTLLVSNSITVSTTPVTRNTTPTLAFDAVQTSPLISLSPMTTTGTTPTQENQSFVLAGTTTTTSHTRDHNSTPIPLVPQPPSGISAPASAPDPAVSPPALASLPTQRFGNVRILHPPTASPQQQQQPSSHPIPTPARQQPHNTPASVPATTAAPSATLPDAANPSAAGSSTPPWDSFNRDEFGYIRNPAEFLAHLPRNSVMFSTTWTHARFDLTRIEEVLDPRTGLFLPWYAPRPDYGDEVRCHPIRVHALFMIKDYFLVSFRTGRSATGYARLDPKHIRTFTDSFPIFGADEANNFLFWHNRVVEHGLRFGVFIPPAHTLRDGKPFGLWFDSLPLDLQHDVVNNFSFLLAACIRSRVHTSLRTERPDILALIQNSTSDGYLLLSDLALHVGRHPMLCKFGSKNMEPRQSADTTLTKYIADWRQYMHHEILDGSILSDRYFHQQLLHNMHPQVRGRIGSYLLQAVMSIPLQKPLPPSFAPDRLLSHITQHVSHLGTRQLLDRTPRQLAGGPTPSLHSFTNSNRPPSRDQSRPSTTASSPTSAQLASLIVAAMRTPGPCLLCRSTDHLFAQCPSFAALRDQPTLIRILQNALQRLSASNSTRSTSNQSRSTNSGPSSNRRPQVRQLTSGGETSSAPPDDSMSPIDSPDLLLLPPSPAGEGHSSDVSHALIPMSEFGEGTPANPVFDSPDFR
jgi:hypothetical protein